MTTDHNREQVKHHIRTYKIVFFSLMVLTLITVAISKLHLSTPIAIGLALLVATIKGSLVACYFMHLISEKKFILFALLLTAVFFLFCIFLPLFTHLDFVGEAPRVLQ